MAIKTRRSPCALLKGAAREAWHDVKAHPVVVVVLRNKNPPTPCLWQAPASTQKTKRKTRPAIRRSARWRVKRWSTYHISLFFNDNAQRSK